MILPGSTVVIKNPSSIYNGYEGCVQRISGDKVAVLLDQNYSLGENDYISN